jgi:hypothetical protein
MAPLRPDLSATGLLGNPARHLGTGPQATTRCRTGDGGSQLLLLLGGEQGPGGRWHLLLAAIPHAGWSLRVIAAHHPTGVADLQTNQTGSSDGGVTVVDQDQELPAACLDLIWGMARTVGKVLR